MIHRKFRIPLCEFNGPLICLGALCQPSLATRDQLFAPSACRVKLFSEKIDLSIAGNHAIDILSHTIPPEIARSIPKRKAEFVAGRRAAIRALQALQCSVEEIPVGLHRSPEWPRDYVGSISHTDGIAVAVAMRQFDAPGHRAIGIDIEHVVSESTASAVHSVAFNSSEQACVNKLLSAIEPRDASTIIFSCKESFFKAAFPYVRQYFDFSAIDIVDFKLSDGTILGQVTQDLAPPLCKGTTVVFNFTALSSDIYITWCGW
ncbi:hypothetical protein XarjCFBP7652_20580 [Xanthomonas arboricola]|nr:hypothetical protein XarjCFBP7652_20580 [Xanthomonas arboricola]